MKKFLSAILFLALGIGLQAADIKVEIRKMTEGAAGNQRFPVVAHNARGERIFAYRGGDSYVHYYRYRNGTWTNGGRIPGSPQFDDFWFSDIVTDSTGTFHYVCEDADSAMYYAYFQDGAWAPMSKVDIRHEATLALGVQSDDTIVLVSAMITRSDKGVTKDVILGTKRKEEKQFSRFKNVTQDFESSTMVDAAVDAKDNVWIAYKGAFLEKGGGETLQAVLLGQDKTFKGFFFKNVSGQENAWCWYARVAVNSEGKIMVTWFMSQQLQYFYRLYDPETRKWTEVKSIMSGPRSPWPTMYNKILARGTDFYWVGLAGDRYAKLFKYDAKKDAWTKLADVSNAAANWCSAASTYDKILIPWDSLAEPTSCYLTSVSVTPAGPPPVEISGKVLADSVGLEGVTLTGLPGNPETDSSGNYEAFVTSDWTGTVVPVKPEWAFSPASRTYTKITDAQTGQDYAAFPPISSVANLRVEKRIERGFFRGYTLNALTWEANPANATLNITVSAQRVYRKGRTEADSAWTRIAELAGTVLKFEDRNLAQDSDYVYAVTCMDDRGNESPVY